MEPSNPPPSTTPLPEPVVPSVPDTISSTKQVKFNFFRFLLLLLIPIIGILALVVWYFQAQSTQVKTSVSYPSPSVEAQVLVVGTDPTWPPMESLVNGELVGYDIDLANFLAEELGTEVEFKNIVFDDLFTALEKQEIDMIISAVTITPERQEKFDFSAEYLNAGQVIITQKSNTTIASTADLRSKKIGVQTGTTNETEALKYTEKNLVIGYPDVAQATQALVASKVDAIFTDLPNAKVITIENPTLKIASDPFTDEYYGIVFRKGDPYATKVNEALASLRIKGRLIDLKKKWLD